VTCTEGRRLRKCRRDAAALTGTGGTRARHPPAAAAGTNDAGGRRESKKARGGTVVAQPTPAPTSVVVAEPIQSMPMVPPTPAPVTSSSLSALLECPAPNCSKKFRDQSGLQYHQSHAHRKQSDSAGGSQPVLDSFVAEPDCKPLNGHQSNSKHSALVENEISGSAVSTDTSTKSSFASSTSPTGKRSLPVSAEGGDGTPASKRQRVDDAIAPSRVNDQSESVDDFSAVAMEHNGVIAQVASSAKQIVKDEPVELLTNIKRESDAGLFPLGDGEILSKDELDGSSVNSFRKSKGSTPLVGKDHLLRPTPNAVDRKPVGGEAISPAYSDISDTTANADGGSARPNRGDHHSLLEHGAGRHSMNGRLPPSVVDQTCKDLVGSSRSIGMAPQSASSEIGSGIDRHKLAPDSAQVQSLGAMTKDRNVDTTSKNNAGQQQQQAAAMEYIQMESMRQAYLQMYGGGSSSPGLPPGPGVAPPFGFGVDPTMAYRMQLMAAAAAAAGPREFNPHLEHWMAAAAAASGGHHRGVPGGGGGIFPGLDPAGGSPVLGPGDAKPVDMSSKRMQSATPTDHRSRSPSGSASMSAGPRDSSLTTPGGRSQTPLSSGGGGFRPLGDTPNASSNHHQQRGGSSSHSSHHRDRHGAAPGRSHSGSSGRVDASADGHSSSSSRIPPLSVGFDGSTGSGGNDPTPPLLQRRPDDPYDGPSPAAVHRRSLDLIQQQQQLPRHRGGGSTTPSSGSNRATTPRGGLFPAGRDDDKVPLSGASSSSSTSSSRWNPSSSSSSSKDAAAAFAGRSNPAAGGVPGTLPSGPGSSPIPSPAAGTCGPYTPGPPSGHHRESPQTKRHVHTHHHTHVINAAYPVYGQYPSKHALNTDRYLQCYLL